MLSGIRIFLVLVLVLATNDGYTQENWVADEIVKEISEMRKSIQDLRNRVSQLETRIAVITPRQPEIPLKATEGMSLGASDAEFAIVVFSDYECPYCARHETTVLPQLRKHYIDKGLVKYVVKDFPLAFHRYARKAAIAARCSGEQGKYWPMHDEIFAAKGKGNDGFFSRAAVKLGLNANRFRSCLSDTAQTRRVEEDLALGEKLGVQGTPTFFIGHVKDGVLSDYKRFDGVRPFEAFSGVINELSNHWP